jgi:hypothetical protein
LPSTNDTQEFDLRFPLFAVLSTDDEGDVNVVVLEIDASDCLPLFRNRELAELYVEQCQEDQPQTRLELHPCDCEHELGELLRRLPPSVDQVIWDTTTRPKALRVTAVSDLLRILDTGETE